MDSTPEAHAGPAVICYDGSPASAAAVAAAARLLPGRRAVVLTVWEPVRVWEPYDPATIVSAPLSRLASQELGLDEIAEELARERNDQGVALAQAAGLQATGRVERGKTCRAICATARDLDGEAIVLGARGLGRVESALLGSVSAAVIAHAHTPVLVVPGEDD